MHKLAHRLRAAATDTSREWPAELLVEASRAIDTLASRVDQCDTPYQLHIDGTWLVRVTADCTCTTGPDHHYLCGVKPIANLTEVPGFMEFVHNLKE